MTTNKEQFKKEFLFFLSETQQNDTTEILSLFEDVGFARQFITETILELAKDDKIKFSRSPDGVEQIFLKNKEPLK